MKQLSEQPIIDQTSRIIQSELGKFCEVGPYSVLQNTIFGDYSYSGSNCIFQNVIVGKFSNIAAYVRVGATDHPMERPTLHHFTYRSKMYGFSEQDDLQFFEHRKSRVTTIGHDTWIGHGAMIKPGVTIGNGAIVGQGAVVTKNVAPYTIVAGNPAKVIRHRFTREVIDALEAIAWWDWSYDTIKENFEDFRGSALEFTKKYINKEEQK